MAQPPVLPIATRGSDFSPLLREVKAAGLLERRTAAYAMAIGINVGLMALTWAAIATVGATWWVCCWPCRSAF